MIYPLTGLSQARNVAANKSVRAYGCTALGRQENRNHRRSEVLFP